MKIKIQLNRKIALFYFVLICFIPLAGNSQDIGSCAEKLKTAQSLFDEGHVEQVPAMLKDCMKSGFNREESLDAYKLLIQTFLFEENLGKADSAMLSFLKINPEYKISPTDHSSFVNLCNSFRVKPVVQIALHIGTNLPYLSIIKEYQALGESTKSTYSTKALNLFGSVEAKFELTKKIELNFEAGYSQLAFTNVRDVNGTKLTRYTETQRRIEIPFSATYNFKSFGQFTPFARLGFGPALNLGSTASVIYTHSDKNNPLNLPSPDLDRKESRIFIDMFSQIGGGIKLKTRGGYVTAELRSNFGILNQTIQGGDPVNEQDLSLAYKYIDDDFRVNNLNFNFGYTLIFYKPSKRKE